MSADHHEPPSPLPAPAELDVFAQAPFALEHLLQRLDQYETPLAVVDEEGRVVDANGPWKRREGLSLWCGIGEVLASIDPELPADGDGLERLAKELGGVLRGRTQFCEWDAESGEHVSLTRLVAVSGNYALAVFQPAIGPL